MNKKMSLVVVVVVVVVVKYCLRLLMRVQIESGNHVTP
jgi:hypothetical protein